MNLCKEFGLNKLAKHVPEHYSEVTLGLINLKQVTSKVLIKLLRRCAEFFSLRKELVTLLRDINFRELSLQSLKRFVTSLDNTKDRRAMERIKSTKSMMLF